MGLIFLGLRGLTLFTFSGAALLTSISFLNKSKQEPVQQEGISLYQAIKLALISFSLYVGYKFIMPFFK